MNYAIVEDGIVTNVIVGPLPDGMDGICVDGMDVAIGDLYANGVFIKPEPPASIPIKDQIAALEAQLVALRAQLQ